ncbi:MAG TPA: pitrilysin family protein [Polyangia bacterium]|nr:pitrilysin family protein [Polyangia bacterium]
MTGRRGRRWLLVCGGLAACAAAPDRPQVANVARSAPTPGDESFRAAPPLPQPEPPFRPPAVQASTLSNGMRLLIVERHTFRLAAAELVVVGGAAGIPRETRAAVDLMVACLTGGTNGLAQSQLFEEMNSHLIDLRPRMGDSALTISMRAPSRWLDRGLHLMRAVALDSAFPKREFEIFRNQQVGHARLAVDNTTLIAQRNLFGAIYGPTHPYARAYGPREEDLAKVTRDDVVRVWKEVMDPSAAVLLVAGDVDPREVIRLAEAEFGGWKHDPRFPPRPTVPAPAPGAARLVVVDRPGARQATVLFGAPAPGMRSPQHPTDFVIRDLFGGMRSSTLATELRHELGATWQEGVGFAIHPTMGLDWWYGSVAPDRTTAVLRALDQRLRDLRERGPSADELAAAKATVVRSFPHWFELTSHVVERLAEAAVADLPPDEPDRTFARVSEVSADEVRAAVPDPAAVRVVVVGDLAVLKEPLLGLGWGPIDVNDAQGRRLRTLSP